ncbi:hypothetical protein PVK06_044715 [Gossypium arboreum]|uniref:Tesmin/TSO1-like CXC domain-containing protein n=1 Tax=Gossypium arboreum TaxID=29729 RepID=A0ABR0MSG7_GOSAR|nr:hypothetical protein PVK06_044715 [Gossypium arboreum]
MTDDIRCHFLFFMRLSTIAMPWSGTVNALVRYCECFASGMYCDECNCVNCYNNVEYEAVRRDSVGATLKSSLNAFRPKINSSSHGAKDNKCSNYTQDSSGTYAVGNAGANSLHYQQHYKQWVDYYNQTEVSGALGTENLSVASTSTQLPSPYNFCSTLEARDRFISNTIVAGLSFCWMHGPRLAEFMHSDDLFELTADLKVCILSLFCSICILLDFWCSMISVVFCLIVLDQLFV